MAVNHRIMIVDDTLDIARMLSTALLAMNETLNVSVVPSAEEAMLDASREQVDLLVTDIRLPGISGFDLVRKIRARYPHIKVIMITGMSEENITMQASEMGIDAVLHKPLELQVFTSLADRLLQSSPALKESSQPAREKEKTGNLVRNNGLPDEVGAILNRIRQNLSAVYIGLIHTSGFIPVMVGEPPFPAFESEWVPSLQAVAGAQSRLSMRLNSRAGKGVPPENITALRGEGHDVMLAVVGEFLLVVVLKTGRTPLRMTLAVEEILGAEPGLIEAVQSARFTPPDTSVQAVFAAMVERNARATGALVQTPASVEPSADAASPAAVAPERSAAHPSRTVSRKAKSQPVVEEPPENPASLEELSQLLQNGATAVQNADDFWEQATAEATDTPVDPDAISYEEARRRGLAVQDE